jgi:hypothetical protein
LEKPMAEQKQKKPGRRRKRPRKAEENPQSFADLDV